MAYQEYDLHDFNLDEGQSYCCACLSRPADSPDDLCDECAEAEDALYHGVFIITGDGAKLEVIPLWTEQQR